MKKTLSILFASALVLSFSLMTAGPVAAQSWLAGWSHRVEIAIDSDKIDESLVDFPVLLYLSTSSGLGSTDVSFIFDELGANRKKIAVTTSDGTTQCYVEIEKWDSVNEQAWLWVGVPNIASGVNTVLYLYYDNSKADNTTYVGETGTTPAQNAWDSSFVGVWHKADGPAQAILDSTSYANDGTKKGDNEPQEVDGRIGKAQSYDGMDDYVDVGDDASLQIGGEGESFTLTAWTQRAASGTEHIVISQGTDALNQGLHLRHRSDNTMRFGFWTNDLDTPTAYPDVGEWHHWVATYDGATNARKIYRDGVSVAADTSSADYIGPANTEIGKRTWNAQHYNGLIEEVRISNVARSAAWIKATYHSGNDGLLTYGDEESLTQCIATATSTGTACFTPSHGVIEDLVAVSPPSLPSVSFPHGMFSFKITGLTPGQTVTLTITLPAAVPVSTRWWKYQAGAWYSLPIGSDDGDKIITITLIDGGLGDADIISGQITDPGGPGNPTVGWETYPINRLGVMAPWIALFAAIMAGALIFVRRRRAQS